VNINKSPEILKSGFGENDLLLDFRNLDTRKPAAKPLKPV
jgi:hypothetical protein